MAFESLTPVQEITVVWACRPSYLGVALDRSDIVFLEHMPLVISEDPACAGFHVPVFSDNPWPVFGRMSAVRPSPQLLIHEMVTEREGFCGYHGSIGVGPPSNNRVERSDQVLLRCRSQFPDALADVLQMVLNGSLAWLDDRLEAQRFSPGVFSGVGFAYRVLPVCLPGIAGWQTLRTPTQLSLRRA